MCIYSQHFESARQVPLSAYIPNILHVTTFGMLIGQRVLQTVHGKNEPLNSKIEKRTKKYDHEKRNLLNHLFFITAGR